MKLLANLNKEQLKHLALAFRILGGCSLGLITQARNEFIPLLLLGFAIFELCGVYILGQIKED